MMPLMTAAADNHSRELLPQSGGTSLAGLPGLLDSPKPAI